MEILNFFAIFTLRIYENNNICHALALFLINFALEKYTQIWKNNNQQKAQNVEN